MFKNTESRAVILIENITKDEMNLLNIKKTKEDGSIVTDFLIESSYGLMLSELLKTREYKIINFYSLKGDKLENTDNKEQKIEKCVNSFLEEMFSLTDISLSSFNELKFVSSLKVFLQNHK